MTCLLVRALRGITRAAPRVRISPRFRKKRESRMKRLRAFIVGWRSHRSLERPAPLGLKTLVTALTVCTLIAGAGGPASADSRGINFETSQGYHLGTIQNQPGVTPPPAGWGAQTPGVVVINPAIDQEVVNGAGRPSSFGAQSWRISNYFTSGSFGDQPFSPSLTNEAGETLAQNLGFSGGTRQNHFDVQWAFASADPTGPERDSYVSTSPDRGDGARMSYMRLEDHPWGIELHFSDYQDNAPRGGYGNALTAAPGCGPEDVFTDVLVATVSRNRAHTFRLSIDFIDGPHNDVVKVYVDGMLRHVGTTWEDYFRWCTESGGGTGTTTADQSRTVDSLLFRVGGADGITHVDNFGKGFFFDNLFYASSTREDCDKHHGHGDGGGGGGGGGVGGGAATMGASNSNHFHFDKEGCEKDDRDNARHDDDEHGHHFQSSSVDYAEYDTVGNGRQMTMVGSGTDNGEAVTFTIVAVDYGGLIPSTYSIVLSNGYAWAGTVVGTMDIQ